MIALAQGGEERKRKAVLAAGVFFIVIVLSSILIMIIGELHLVSESLFNAQMLAKIVIFNVIILIYLNRFSASCQDLPAPNSLGEALAEEFLRIYSISKREQEIVQLICRGKSNAEIGGYLYISLPTVQGHFHSIFQKTRVKNRVQLVNLINASAGTKTEKNPSDLSGQ